MCADEAPSRTYPPLRSSPRRYGRHVPSVRKGPRCRGRFRLHCDKSAAVRQKERPPHEKHRRRCRTDSAHRISAIAPGTPPIRQHRAPITRKPYVAFAPDPRQCPSGVFGDPSRALAWDSSGCGAAHPERRMGFAGDQHAPPPDTRCGRNGRHTRRGIGPGPSFPPRRRPLSGRSGHPERADAVRHGARPIRLPSPPEHFDALSPAAVADPGAGPLSGMRIQRLSISRSSLLWAPVNPVREPSRRNGSPPSAGFASTRSTAPARKPSITSRSRDPRAMQPSR